jgi:hypothetical protein
MRKAARRIRVREKLIKRILEEFGYESPTAATACSLLEKNPLLEEFRIITL